MAEQQTWLTHEVTPSGIEVRFGVQPKRLYQVRKSSKAQWKDAPSVTEILNCLSKDGLKYWGQRVGIDGCLHLIREGAIGRFDGVPYCAADEGSIMADVPAIEALLNEAKLSVTHVRDKAADRGKSVHDAFELWAKDPSVLPDPGFFPESESGYVEGLVAFLKDVQPEPVSAEVMVGSVKHGFAGRYDLRMRVPTDCEVVFHRTPVRGPQTKTLPAGEYLCDLKTSKSVYSSHARQLEAYEAASIECGYSPTDGRTILHVTADGNYSLVNSWATFHDFLVVLKTYQSDQLLKQARKESK